MFRFLMLCLSVANKLKDYIDRSGGGPCTEQMKLLNLFFSKPILYGYYKFETWEETPLLYKHKIPLAYMHS